MLTVLSTTTSLQLAAAIAALLALIFAHMGLRIAGQAHYRWLALGSAVLALWWGLPRPLTADGAPAPGFGLSVALGLAALMLLWVGMVRHLRLPAQQERRLLGTLLAANGLLTLLLQGVFVDIQPYPRILALALVYSQMLIVAPYAFAARRQERGVGHGLVGAIFVALPLLAWLDWFRVGSAAVTPRAASLPVLALGLVVLRAGHLREHRRLALESAARQAAEEQLRCLNRDLEQRVSERTAQLAAALDAAQAASRAKSRFVALMSHEIRTPLGGLMGSIDLLRDEVRGTGRVELLDMAASAGSQLRRVLDDVLDFSRIEAGEMPIELRSVDPAAVAAGAVQAFTALAAGKGLSLSLDLPAPPPRVLCDEVRLRQILDNLIGNAVKFTESGGARLRLTAQGRPDGRTDLGFEVIDSGIGIPPAARELIFEPFEQGRYESIESRPHGGTGLGLALCRKLAQLLGGDIACRDNPGGGSVFAVTLPCERAPAAPAAARATGGAAEPAPLPAGLAGLRVLVADDNPIILAMLGRVLARAGLSVATVRDGAEAVRAVGEQPFDVLLMDISMPRLNGLEATRAIRSGSGGAGAGVAALPIIGISAHALAGDREQCLAAGMNAYLVKPLDTARLLQAIAAVAVRGQGAGTPPGPGGSLAQAWAAPPGTAS